jgi:hypothetical protein
MKFKTLRYFASTLVDPLWKVFEVLDDKNHPLYDDLINDIKTIDNDDLEKFTSGNHIDHLLGRYVDKEFGKRVYYMVYKLQNEIAKERIIKLLESDRKPEPYNSENISQLELDKNYLISTNQLNLTQFRFQYGPKVYELCPITGGSNSSYWIFQAILFCIRKHGFVFKVRLDPFKEIPSEDYSQMMYKMYVHGKPLNWDKLLELRNEDFGQWFNERNNSFTDFVWTPTLDELSFTCEEFPSFSYDGLYTSRYFHAIFNKKTGGIKHCDGAIRIYDYIEKTSRSAFHVRQSEVRKIGKRVKVFQFDSNENQNKEITRDDFSQLTVNFFVWNHDVQNYFNI